jgi:anti-sigma B factor antagonist
MSSGIHIRAQTPPAPRLTLVDRSGVDEVRLSLSGEIDLASVPELERELRDAESSRPARIVLDFSAVEFIDSSGIHMLVDALQRADAAGHRLVLTHVPGHARRVFDLTGIAPLLVVA